MVSMYMYNYWVLNKSLHQDSPKGKNIGSEGWLSVHDDPAFSDVQPPHALRGQVGEFRGRKGSDALHLRGYGYADSVVEGDALAGEQAVGNSLGVKVFHALGVWGEGSKRERGLRHSVILCKNCNIVMLLS